MPKRRTVLGAAMALTGVGTARARGVAPMVEHPYARANYIPDPPARARVGTGKVIRGRVVMAESGAALPGARVEFYLNTTPDAGGIGEQNPANRGQVQADADGRFAFECDPPQTVGFGAAPHVHTRATAEGHEPFFYRHLTPSTASTDEVIIVLVSA